MPSGTGSQGWSDAPLGLRGLPDGKLADPLLGALQEALATGAAADEVQRFIAGIERAQASLASGAEDAHWSLYELAQTCDRASEALLEHSRLDEGIAALRLGLTIRQRLAGLATADELFRSTVDIPIEIAASHLAIANAFRRGARPCEALDEMRAGIAAYRRNIEAGSDPYALDTLAAHIEDAGRIARDIPNRDAMRAHFEDSLALRERATQLAPEDPDLARAYVEACIWRAPDLGKASAAWLNRARRLLAEREVGPNPVPGTARLRNLVDTAGAPYLSS